MILGRNVICNRPKKKKLGQCTIIHCITDKEEKFALHRLVLKSLITKANYMVLHVPILVTWPRNSLLPFGARRFSTITVIVAVVSVMRQLKTFHSLKVFL